MQNKKLLIAILAGGVGRRLWPISSKDNPKQFIKFGEKSSFQKTLEINKNLGKLLVVCREENYLLVKKQISEINIKDVQIILENDGRNTAPSSMISTLIAKNLGYENILITPSDHIIKNKNEYELSIKKSLKHSKNAEVVCFGATPNFPSTEYGYIKLKNNIEDNIYSSDKFIEKPKLRDAKKFIDSKDHCWNCGIFVFNISQIFHLFNKKAPELFKKVINSYNKISGYSIKYDFEENISLDYALLEKLSKIKVIISNLEWKDCGSFSYVLQNDTKNQINNSKFHNVITDSSFDNFLIFNNKKFNRKIALAGVTNLLIFESNDILFIANKNNIDGINQLRDKMQKNNYDISKEEKISVLDNFISKDEEIVEKPWGYYKVLETGKGYKVKKLVIFPGKSTSLQYHKHRKEVWNIIDGKAEAIIGNELKILNKFDQVEIRKLENHRLKNISNYDLHIIEIQTGDYLEEDDIVRI